MRRVSSRQRIVSWDNFDAVYDNSKDEDASSEYSDYDAAPQTPLDLSSINSWDLASIDGTKSCSGRKRSRRVCQQPGAVLAAALIPSDSWDESQLQLQPKSPLDALVVDVQVQICSYLDLSSLQNVQSVNHSWRRLVRSPEAASTLWSPQVESKWKISASPPKFLDQCRLRTPLAEFSQGINLSILFSMTPPTFPTEIDQSLLKHHGARMMLPRRHRALAAPTALKYYQEGSRSLIHYRGAIGAGDRCVRSNYAFPRPPSLDSRTPADDSPAHLLELLCRGARAVANRWAAPNPFCIPHVQANGMVNVSPRMVAYYEVDIMALPSKSQDTEDNDDRPTPLMLPHNNSSSSQTECVAVGLATERFHVHSRMPGWDGLSFGYHGDDGGIFHKSGAMLKPFGPRFGPGDTVGCGVDYMSHGVFFTLNGKFLGYGWKGGEVETLLKRETLYPVVGIDTNAPISLNFGLDRPFAYDLSEMIGKYADLIACQYPLRGGSKSSFGAAVVPPTSPMAVAMRRDKRQHSF